MKYIDKKVKENLEELKISSTETKYRMLDHWRQESTYYLGGRDVNDDFMWAGNASDQIDCITQVFNSLSEIDKPNWFNSDNLENLKREIMKKVNDNLLLSEEPDWFTKESLENLEKDMVKK